MHRRARLIWLINRRLYVILLLVLMLTTGCTRGEQLAMHAMSHMGIPYVLGGKGPDTFDCSGLILHCFADYGYEFPHSARDIGTKGDYETFTEIWRLRTGDIVYFDTVDDADPSDHVGIWIGCNQFVHASSTSGEVVVSALDGFYLETYTGARRVIDPYELGGWFFETYPD